VWKEEEEEEEVEEEEVFCDWKGADVIVESICR
jgi:hypothetical protein